VGGKILFEQKWKWLCARINQDYLFRCSQVSGEMKRMYSSHFAKIGK
jgi:hypothetical protein